MTFSHACSCWYFARRSSLLSVQSGLGKMQFAGQTSLHCGSSSAPTHSVHFIGSMMYIGLPTEIALFGHTGSQASQAVQASVIISAMMSSLPSGRLRQVALRGELLE